MIKARDEKRLLRLQDQFARVSLLIVDELSYVPLSQTGSELLFQVFSQGLPQARDRARRQALASPRSGGCLQRLGLLEGGR